MNLRTAVLAGAAALGTATAAIVASAQQAPTWDDVGPIFADNCTRCHGPGGRAGLNLSTYDTALAGSSFRVVLVSGDPDNSRLVERITGQITPQMPRGAAPLSQDDIDTIIAWIAGGLQE